MSKTALANHDLTGGEAAHEVIAGQNYMKRFAPDARHGITSNLSEAKPFAAAELGGNVSEALYECLAAGIDILSAAPEWLELRVPCDLRAILPLQKVLAHLDSDLPEEIREAISYACQEMLCNAIEYGCRLDSAERVEVRFVRLKRAIICWIKDHGAGFDPTRLAHAAINNPNEDPIHHVFVREEKGLRPGGFGILLTSQLVDELVYNERHNELLFVKYLSQESERLNA